VSQAAASVVPVARLAGTKLAALSPAAEEFRDMTLIFWLILGVALGYLGNLVLSADPDRGCFLNVLLGTLGALGTGFLLVSHVRAAGTQSTLSAETLLSCLVALLVAVVLVALANLLRRGRLR
jgi:uncharacterized membrane protein YeaQ/YmgE (transglycosylase-associated protein family)